MSTTFKNRLDNRYGPGTSNLFRGLEKSRIKLTKEEEHINFLREARNNDVIPVGFRLRSTMTGARSVRILERASKELLRSQLGYHRWRKAQLANDCEQRYQEIIELTLDEDYEPIFAKIDYTCQKLRENLRTKHQSKLQKLNATSTCETNGIPPNVKTIINVSKRTLSNAETEVLNKGLNFAISSKPSVLDVITSVEAMNLPRAEADELRYEIRSTLDQLTRQPPKTNISREEQTALRDLKRDTDIKILPADKGNATVVMDVDTYDNKVKEVLNKGEYRLLTKDPTPTVEGRIYRALKKYSAHISDALRTKLTPHHSKPPHFYGLPKIHKEQMPLRPITSSRDSPTSELSRFLLSIIKPLQGNTESFVKNSTHFVELLQATNIRPSDKLVSFDVESLYTNVPIKESLNIIKERLRKDTTLAERTGLPLEGVVELLEVCLRNSYFQVKDRFYAQDEGLPMGSPLSPVVANIYMEWFEEHAIRTAQSKPKMWLRYVDDTFIIWDKSDTELTDFLEHLNNIRPSIKFTMELETESTLPFLDVLVRNDNGHLKTSVYRKPTHTGQYLHYNSNHPASTKVGIIKTLYRRAATICNNSDDLKMEIENITRDLQQNGYPIKLIRTTIRKAAETKRREPQELEESSGFLTIPYIKGTSEKIRRIARKFNVKTAFTSNTTIRSLVSKTKPESPVDTKNCVYQIPCECGDSYIGETKRPLEVRTKEHQKWTRTGEVSRSGIAEHAWSNSHNIHWTEAKILCKEQHWRKRKFLEATYITQNQGIFSQPSVEIPNIWRPLLSGLCMI